MTHPESKNAKKRKLLRRVRRQRLKHITILPSLITLINGICGFASIVFASKAFSTTADEFTFRSLQMPYFAMAGYMIFFAMIADMLDGRVARMSQTTSSFGGQLDSLSDMISFGAAPAFLMLKILHYKLAEFSFTPLLGGFLIRFIWLSAALYMSCAAIRLARFNVENEEDETAHMSFIGLPTPGAAGVVASLVVFYQDILQTVGENTPLAVVVLYLLPFITIASAILMISRIRYPHLVNLYLKGRKPMTHLFWTIAIFALIFLFGLPRALVISFCGFAASGFTRWFYRRIVTKTVTSAEPEPPVLSITDSSE